MENLKMIMVCLTTGKKCDEDGFVAESGKATHLFCCEDGFKQSLKDFSSAIAERYKCHVCHDTGLFQGESCPAC